MLQYIAFQHMEGAGSHDEGCKYHEHKTGKERPKIFKKCRDSGMEWNDVAQDERTFIERRSARMSKATERRVQIYGHVT